MQSRSRLGVLSRLALTGSHSALTAGGNTTAEGSCASVAHGSARITHTAAGSAMRKERAADLRNLREFRERMSQFDCFSVPVTSLRRSLSGYRPDTHQSNTGAIGLI